MLGADSEIAYKKNIENIDRSCRWLVVAMQVSILFMYLPLLLYSYFNYCILELGPNSYFLVYPVKYVFVWIVIILISDISNDQMIIHYSIPCKASIRLENTARVSSGMVCSICRTTCTCINFHFVDKLRCCNMLAFRFHGQRYYNGPDCFQ